MNNCYVQAKPGDSEYGSTKFLRKSMEVSEEKGRPSDTPANLLKCRL